MAVIEIVSWDAKASTDDQEMINALNDLVPDLKTLPGFREQTAGKDSKGRWQSIYSWETSDDAHASNELMAERESLSNLMMLLDPQSITIEVIEPRQSSS